MGRVNKPILSESQKSELEALFKASTIHSLRKRCQTILLKAEGRDSIDVGRIAVSYTHLDVYKRQGFILSNQIGYISFFIYIFRNAIHDNVF